MNLLRYGRPALGFALAASMSLFPACTKKPAGKAGPAGAVIHGRILAADGSAPRLAHVRYTREDGQEVSLDAKADGSFEISVRPGLPVTLRVAAVDHVEIPVPVLIEGTEPATVEVTLAPNPWVTSFDKVLVTGSWSHHSFAAAEPMKRQADGTWVYDGPVPGGDATARYELIGITTNGHSVNGTMGDGFVYDGGGDFDSIVPVKDGKVHIVFDPAKLPHYDAAGLPKVVWDAGHGDLNRMARLASLFQTWMYRFATAFDEHRKAGGAPEDFHFDSTKLLETIHGEMAESSPQAIRQYAAVMLVTEGPSTGIAVTSEELDEALKVAPPDSPYWGFGPTALTRILPNYGKKAGPILKRFATENPLPQVQAWALAGEGMLAQKSGDNAKLRSIYGRLEKDYASLPGMRWVLRDLNPDKKVQVGKPVPHFEVALLDGSHFSDKDLKGHWTLMDFWATWCPPCVGEMPNLDRAWKTYHPRGLQMLSLSLDRNDEDIAAFRKNKWPMPWKHAFLEGGFKNNLAKDFEVSGIPSPILVAPDGTIAAMGQDLRGETLATTLKHYLGAAGKAK